MHILSPKLTSRLPVRIDISWMKKREGVAATTDAPAQTTTSESPERALLVNQILELNPSASPDFLAQFAPSALGDYLEHLTSASMPRGRLSRRLRPDNTPGVIVRTARI